MLKIGGNGKGGYDLKGMKLMPGWIDTHTHPSWHFDENGRYFGGRESIEQKLPYAVDNAKATLLPVFTTIQSLGARVGKPLRDSINAGERDRPRMITSLGSLNERSVDPEKMRA